MNHCVVSVSPLLNFGAVLTNLAQGKAKMIEVKADYVTECRAAYAATVDKGIDAHGIAHVVLAGEIYEADPCLAMWFGLAVPSVIGDAIRKYDELADCKGIHLHVNSGGGAISAVPELADAVYNCSKPITAYVTEQCCSAAYWIASQCDSIIATRGAVIGSLGVYIAIADTSKQFEMDGVKVHLVSTAELKGMGEAGVPLTEAQKAFLQSFIDRSGELFIADIKRARPSFDSSLFSGAFWHSEDALDLGLIDDVLI